MKRRTFLKTISAIGAAISTGVTASASEAKPKWPAVPDELQVAAVGELTEYHWLFKYEHRNAEGEGAADRELSQEAEVSLREFTGRGYRLIGQPMVLSGYDVIRDISWRRVSCMAVKT